MGVVLGAVGRIKNGIINDLIADEGFRGKIYYCSEGKPTIGYGFNLDYGFSEKESRAILEYRIQDITNQVSCKFPSFSKLSQPRKDVLVNIAYNVGINGLFKFKKMLLAIESEDYERASMEIMDSRAGRKLVHRYTRLAKKMLLGE